MLRSAFRIHVARLPSAWSWYEYALARWFGVIWVCCCCCCVLFWWWTCTVGMGLYPNMLQLEFMVVCFVVCLFLYDLRLLFVLRT